MAELQKEYIQSFPAKIADIEVYIQTQDITNLINSFHKLKGSGKTYGIPEISELGERFEFLYKNKGSEALPYAKTAVLIIQKIHQSRLQGKPYLILEDADFMSLPK
jgi:HPt (histidine-containing phosphotransfer) domain-containing protein